MGAETGGWKFAEDQNMFAEDQNFFPQNAN